MRVRLSESIRTRPAVMAAIRCCSALLGLLTWQAAAVSPGAPSPATQGRAATLQLPFSFEANRGQVAGDCQFLAHGRDCVFLLSADKAVAALAKPRPGEGRPRSGQLTDGARAEESEVRRVQLRLAGANPRAAGSGCDPLPGRVNYLLGNDPAAWRTDVPTFTKVRFREVYAGVDAIYYGSDRQLELDFVVAPHADPSRITLEISGADAVTVDASGDLVLQVGNEQLRQHRPVSYQMLDGRRVPVESRYHLAGPNCVEFRLGAFDRAQTLVIDPVFSYSTYLGGAAGDVGWDVAVDASGAAFVAGETTSANLLVSAGAYQTNLAGTTTAGGDAFVAKLSPAGTNLVYLTYLGGSSHDGALALAVDGAGNAYVTGFTGSSNFPTVGVLKTNISGQPDASLAAYQLEGFVAKLNADGSALVYSAYLGGDSVDEGIAVAVDSAGRAHVAGYTQSTNLPATGALQPQFGGFYDGFVAKLDPAGSVYEYFTYLGGTNADYCSGIAVDAAGFAYLVGTTQSTNFWSTNAVQPQINNPSTTLVTNLSTFPDAFITKLTPGGALVYSTFLGGGSSESGYRVTPDAAGNAYVVGTTYSTDFPVTTTNLAGMVWTNRAFSDVFVAKVAPDGGSNWVYSVIFGGEGSDDGWDLVTDALGNVSIAGVSSSTNFPVLAVPAGGSATNSGLKDAFVAGLNADGTALTWSFCFGGTGNDYGYAIEPDGSGGFYLVGTTASTNLFVQNALQPVFAGGTEDAFVARLILPPALGIAPGAGMVRLSWPASASGFLLERSADKTGDTWTAVPQPPVVTGGLQTVTLALSNSPVFFRLRLP